VEDLTVVILDRPRHQDLIKRVRKTGARIQLITDGDLAPAVAVAFEGTGVDMMVGPALLCTQARLRPAQAGHRMSDAGIAAGGRISCPSP
jgi:hypothetical protein